MQIRCPHCHNPIELVPEDPSGDVSCPSCGSCFNLAKDIETVCAEKRMIGHFQLLDRLGQGAFGEVWKAKDTQLGRIVAVKIPRRTHLSDSDAQQFFREARAAAQVRHPNIVSVHEVGREDGQIYIAADFINGASLDEWIQAHPLTVRESVELCAKISDALHHAHEAGIVHRDLKPQNILMDINGQPHIADFGLAKRDAGEITMTVEGAILGTPAYMPPEQARGDAHHADRRSDVYSMGVILFRLLTGELPFRGQRQMLIVQILNEEPPAPRKLDARIPRDVETICLKCLEKDPLQRYQSAAELSADLRRWLTGHPIVARPVGRRERVWRWCQRNSTIASLSTAVVAVLLLGIAVSSFFALQSAARNRDLSIQTARANDKANEAQQSAESARMERDRANAKSEESRRLLYAARMNSAQSNWEADRVAVTQDVLARYAPESTDYDLVNFEWDYWNRLMSSCLLNLDGEKRGLWSVALSPNGKQVASSGGQPIIKVWDVSTGFETLALKGHSDTIMSLTFSPDGNWLASASCNGTNRKSGEVRFWNAATGDPGLVIPGDNTGFNSVAYSPDGKWLAAGSADSTVKVWDVANGEEVVNLLGHSDLVNCVAFSPDGQRLASASGYYNASGEVKVWDITSGQVLLNLVGHEDPAFGVAFSPDGNQLASVGGDYRLRSEVFLWDAMNGQQLRTFKGHTNSVRSVTFSPDGRRLATSSWDQTVKVWSASSGKTILTLRGHTAIVNSVVYSRDGRRLVSTGFDNTIKVWDALSGQEPFVFSKHADKVNCVAFSPDGNLLASGGDDRRVLVWDAKTGQVQRTLEGHSHKVKNVVFSPYGRWLASASSDFGLEGEVKVWDVSNGEEALTLIGHGGLCVAFSPDGNRIASVDWDSESADRIKIWDTSSGQELITLKGREEGGVSERITFSPDGTQLASASGSSVTVWNVLTGNLILSVQCSREVNSVVYSADGKRLATAVGNGVVQVWDAASGQELMVLKGHSDRVIDVAFSPDQLRFASAGFDKVIKIWDATTGQETLSLKGHTNGVSSVVFSPDGRRLASASYDGTVRVWDARPWTPDLRAEQEALSFVRVLEEQGVPFDEWATRISADQVISPSVRQQALQFAREWHRQ